MAGNLTPAQLQRLLHGDPLSMGFTPFTTYKTGASPNQEIVDQQGWSMVDPSDPSHYLSWDQGGNFLGDASTKSTFMEKYYAPAMIALASMGAGGFFDPTSPGTLGDSLGQWAAEDSMSQVPLQQLGIEGMGTPMTTSLSTLAEPGLAASAGDMAAADAVYAGAGGAAGSGTAGATAAGGAAAGAANAAVGGAAAKGLLDTVKPYLPLAGAAIGALSSKDQQATQKNEPWGPAQDWIKQNINRGQQLQQQYTEHPFSPQQMAAYNNVGGLLNALNSGAPGLLAGMGATAAGQNNFDRLHPNRPLIGGGLPSTFSNQQFDFFPR